MFKSSFLLLLISQSVSLSIIIPILFWLNEKPLWRAIDATATMMGYNPKLATFIHQTTWEERVFNRECVNVRWSQKSDDRKNEASLSQTYRVPQQVNTILCVIHSRKPQPLYRNKTRTFMHLCIKFEFYKNNLYIVDHSMYLIVDGPMPGFRVHLIVFGFQAAVTLKRNILCQSTIFTKKKNDAHLD